MSETFLDDLLRLTEDERLYDWLTEPNPFHDEAVNGSAPASELRFTPLEAFAAVDEPGAQPLASTGDRGVVIAAGGDMLVYGDGGAGKTTLVLDLCFALAAGDPWLGLIHADRPLRIALVENEGPRPMLRRKLERKLAATGAKLDGHVFVLEEPWGDFTFADEAQRHALALAIAELELDLVVVGPLISAGEFPNGGTPAEVARFEEHTKALRRLLADRPFAILLVHHENKAGQISGGWGRFGDTHLHVTAQGNGRTRLFWQKARWASSLHRTASQLLWADGESFTLEEKPEISEDTMAEALVAAIRAYPGSSWSKIRDLRDDDGGKRVRGNLSVLEAIRDRLLAEGVIVNCPARSGQFNLWVADDPGAPRSGVGTGSERHSFLPAAEAADPTRSAVPSIERNGYGNGTDPAGPQTVVEEEEGVS